MTRTLHRWSGFAVMGLPLVALLTVLTGFGQPPQADEGITACQWRSMKTKATSDCSAPGRGCSSMSRAPRAFSWARAA
jgi:hypothetical protein